MSHQSKGLEGHVDLDQKNPDSVYYDEGFMPELQRKKSGGRKDKLGSSRTNQSKLKRKRVMEKKKRFIEICRDGKMSDKKSTLSREDRRLKRQLFIMENHNKKSVTVSRKPKVKETKKGIMFNDQFDLQGRSSAKSYLQWYLNNQEDTSDDALDIESGPTSPKHLDLSDHEDIRKCCLDYLDSRKDKRTRVKRKKKDKAHMHLNTLEEHNALSKKVKGMKSNGQYLNRNEEDGGMQDEKVKLVKRDFKDAFKNGGGEMKGNETRGIGEGNTEGGGDLVIENDASQSVSDEKAKDVVKKDLGDGLVCLDVTGHFMKYSIIKSIN
jgi:hypothetical protein